MSCTVWGRQLCYDILKSNLISLDGWVNFEKVYLKSKYPDAELENGVAYRKRVCMIANNRDNRTE